MACRREQPASFLAGLDRSTDMSSRVDSRCGTGFKQGQRTLEEGTTSFATRFIACHLGRFEGSYEEETIIVHRQHARMPRVYVIYGSQAPLPDTPSPCNFQRNLIATECISRQTQAALERTSFGALLVFVRILAILKDALRSP